MKTYISAKIHGIRVTGLRLHYHGSQTLPASLLEAAGIEPYEQVHVVNVANGTRWVTYALAGAEGECTLNGAAAHNGAVGDELIIMAYQQGKRFAGAKAILCNTDNTLDEVILYEAEQPSTGQLSRARLGRHDAGGTRGRRP